MTTRMLKCLKRNSKIIIIFLTPILLLPLPLTQSTSVTKCAYGLILMAVYWMTEAFPLPVTAMMPLFIFPFMGIGTVKELASKYYNDITFVFIGGYAVASAIEKCQLHKRFALLFLMLMGTQPKWLLFGFIMSTTFVSMWVGNIATTAMMMPIAHAVLLQLLTPKLGTIPDTVHSNTENFNECNNVDLENEHVQIEMEHNASKIEAREYDNYEKAADYIDFSRLDARSQRLCKATCLCICYGANLGGVATMTGTAPNLVMKGHADLISGGQSGISFQSWFVFACPVTIINAFICWFVLQILFLDWRDIFKRSKDTTYGKEILKQEYQKLGTFTFAEKAVLVHFVILILLWLTLSPDFVPGWGSFFPKGYVRDAVPAVFILMVLFIFPSEWPWNIRKEGRDKVDSIKIAPLLDWKTFTQSLPWGLPVLLGGGFALAHASMKSGLSLWIADKLRVFSSMPVWAMVLMISIIVSLSTEVVSNTAICTIYMPIVSDMAFGVHLHPIYLMLPAAISTSFAFMLPVATPPNAMVFGLGYLKSIDMIKPGCLLNIFCALVLTFAMQTWGRAYLHLDDFPDWGQEVIDSITNATDISFNMTDVPM